MRSRNVPLGAQAQPIHDALLAGGTDLRDDNKAIMAKLRSIAEDVAASKASGSAVVRDIDDLRGRVGRLEARR